MPDVKKHPWALGELVVARSVLDRVDDEARRAYANDEESCGFLVGPAADGRRVDGIVPMVNRANALHRLDPETYPRTAPCPRSPPPLPMTTTLPAICGAPVLE